MNNLYYEYPKRSLFDEKYPLYICSGQRGRGKTTWWLEEMVEDAYYTGNKFVYLRRTEVEMDLVLEKGLYNSVQTIEKNKPFWAKVKKTVEKGGNLYLYTVDGECVHIGYYITLNNVKGISIEDANKLLFDEYIAQTRSKYKGGDGGVHEPELFLRLVDTIFRRKKFTCVLLGNNDTPSNPYNEFWHIPFGSKIYKNKNNGLWYEYDYSEVTAQAKEETTVGLISRGTAYSDYTQGLKSLEEIDEALICDKTPHSEQIYNIRMLGSVLTAWIDRKSCVLYISDKFKVNSSLPIISVTNQDMSVNTDFIRYDINFLYIMKEFYGGGRVRFNSQKVASLFAIMLSLR